MWKEQQETKKLIGISRAENSDFKRNKQKDQNSEAKIKDLEEQVRDLMFFLDTQKKVKKNKTLAEANVQGIS